ncbi:uncharacterized protein B0H18DRAFT_1064580 [Fomitopsis serialis]|uniref:uncharacterized protein n=1 Tax=Fomitopsis serialis TaxID=139415 RepID=UPI002007CFC9|nr:uncharacterized protein B0H18DRAFT_1064580 [Neoantrodia serialis]KAH9911121.1 hypothetical protein B0H18DRAFT_1064580 [Neoantrodia serialis]
MSLVTAEEETAVLLRAQYVDALCGFAFAVVLLYDYVLTVGQEVNLIWRNTTGATGIIFILNRVITLGLVYEGAVQPRNYTYESCKGITISSLICVLFSYQMWATISAIRVYALTGRRLWLSVMTFALGMVPWGLDVYTNTTLYFTVVPVESQHLCQEDDNVTNAFIENIELPICRACSIASDLIVLLVTIYKVLPRPFVFSQISSHSFTRMLLRDGPMLTTLNALEIVLYLTISTVFVSRFILNLRECAAVSVVKLDSQESSESTARQESRTLTFAFSSITHLDAMASYQDDALTSEVQMSDIGDTGSAGCEEDVAARIGTESDAVQ